MNFYIFYISVNFLFLLISFNNATHPLDYCSHINSDSFKKMISVPELLSSAYTLNQVHVIHRHGARVPLKPYYTSCMSLNLDSEILYPCSVSESFTPITGRSQTFDTFKKINDASNVQISLFPNCRTGQLTDEAVDQFEKIGNSLYNTYFAPDKPLSMMTSPENKTNLNELLYFRSTDIERSRLSGALLIKNSLNTEENSEFNIHVSESNADALTGNYIKLCFEDVHYNRALQSKGYKDLSDRYSNELKFINNLSKENFNSFYDSDFLDCYTTAICLNRQDLLPKELVINQESNEDNLGIRIMKAIESITTYVYKFEDAQLSKCTIHNFVEDFKLGFDLKEKNKQADQQKAKFLVYSAHDSLLMMFLSTLSSNLYDGEWPPFASFITFELYKDVNENDFFRLIFRGIDLTDKIDGCKDSKVYIDDKVCEISHLLNSMKWSYTELPPHFSDYVLYSNSYFIYRYTNPFFALIIGAFTGILVFFIIRLISKRNDNRRRVSSSYRQFP